MKPIKDSIGISIIIGFLLVALAIIFLTNRTNITHVSNMPISDGGFVEVELQDQHTEIIDLKLHQTVNEIFFLSNYNIGDRFVNISSISIPIIGQSTCFKEGTAFYQGGIIGVTSLGGDTYTLELDTPLDYNFSINNFGCLTIVNMAVDGSVTPQIFKVSPEGLNDDVEWDITRVIIVMSGEGIGASDDFPDDSDFGVTSALTNGIVLRSVNGITKNIFNIKKNGEFRLRAYDVTYTDKSKAGLFSVGVRRSFAGVDKNGVTVRLIAGTNDSIEVEIQDDLTEMFGMQIVVQGHVVSN